MVSEKDKFEDYWNALLQAKRKAARRRITPKKIEVRTSKSVELYLDDELLVDVATTHTHPLSSVCFLCRGPFEYQVDTQEAMDSLVEFLQTYLPFVFLSSFSVAHGRCFAVTHFAQSLDGRISCITGDSKWIGNDQNLIHAHRMRALCDGILVGRKTYEQDVPQLNVRHVRGENPTKVILGELDEHLIRGIGPEAFFVCDNHAHLIADESKIQMEREGGMFNPAKILRELYTRGISSVYIEGGSQTTSFFLQQGCVDHLQIHYGSLLLGSGNIGFNFENITSMESAMHFRNARFVRMGDDIMFMGEPDYSNAD